MLYLRGLSTGDFREALAALLGDDAAGLSATNIARLTNEWETEYRALPETQPRRPGLRVRLGRWRQLQRPAEDDRLRSGGETAPDFREQVSDSGDLATENEVAWRRPIENLDGCAEPRDCRW